MIKEYIENNYTNGEPILLTELNNFAQKDTRQIIKKLVDEKYLIRIQNGIYYRPYETFMGEGVPYLDLYLKKKFLDNNDIQGYEIGGGLVNSVGLTTQNFAIKRYKSNNASTNIRKYTWNKFTYYIYSSPITITKQNKKELQFLDLLNVVDKYSEIQGDELSNKLKKYIQKENLNLNIIKENLKYYPDRLFRNIYEVKLYELLV